MLRNGMLGLLGVALVASAAAAQVKPVDVRVSSTLSSKYVWNGFDRVEDRGLENGPVLQPRVDVGVAGSPLHAHVGGSFVVNDHSELHEAVYGVSVRRNLSLVADFSAGYNYYDDRVSKIGGVAVDDVDGHEVWAKVGLKNGVGVKPSVTVKYEKPTVDGADAYTVVVGGLSHSVPVVSNVGVAGVGVDVHWQTNVIYNSGVKVAGVDVVKSGVAAWQVGVAGEIRTPAGVVVSPQVSYQVTVEDTVNKDNLFWAGVGVSLGL